MSNIYKYHNTFNIPKTPLYDIHKQLWHILIKLSPTMDFMTNMSQGFKNITMWLFAGTCAYLLAYQTLGSSFVDNHYIPATYDSFYHARRILDAVNNITAFYQFDPRIHVPEGSLLTWPWFYDYAIALIVKSVLAITPIQDPMVVIAYIPPLWVFINVLILLGITIQLGFSNTARFITLLCFSLSPLTQVLHIVGRIDQHYMEHTFVLLCLYTGLSWLQHQSSRLYASLFGISLAFAPAINNGLFILQAPLLLALFIFWIKGKSIPLNSITYFNVSLATATLLLLLPSEPFLRGEFAYYFFSWFHLYIAACTILISIFLAKTQYSKKYLAIFLFLSFILLSIILKDIFWSSRFLTGTLLNLDNITETQNIFKTLSRLGAYEFTKQYTGLIWILPIIVFICIYKISTEKSFPSVYLYAYMLLGSVLMFSQYRLHYFGSFTLYLPLIIWLDKHRSITTNHFQKAVVLSFIIAAYIPAKDILFRNLPPGGTYDYALTRHVYVDLQKECKNDPGTVLADYNDGHYITFHTDCSVIADNFIIMALHEQKILEVDRLMLLSANEIYQKHPDIKYLYISRNDNALIETNEEEIMQKNRGLRAELLLSHKSAPVGYRLIYELQMKNSDNNIIPIARAYKLERIP